MEQPKKLDYMQSLNVTKQMGPYIYACILKKVGWQDGDLMCVGVSGTRIHLRGNNY